MRYEPIPETFRAPSLKTLEALHWLDLEQRRALRAAMRKPIYFEFGRHKSFAIAEHMAELNAIAQTHGAERLRTNRNDYEYLNTGDTYTPTIICDWCDGRFFVSSWGDLAEREGTPESGAVSLPLLAFQACAAIGLASALWSVYLRLVAQIGGIGL